MRSAKSSRRGWSWRYAALIVACLAVGEAAARDLSGAERDALAQKVQSFDAAMRASDYDEVTRIIPPRVIAAIAESAGVGVKDLRKIIVDQMSATFASVKIVSFGMDLGKAEFRGLADGTPYVLVPTETVVEADGAKTAVRSFSLALIDGGEWYLLRVDDPQQLAILRRVYPGFANVEFPQGSMEAVQ